MSRRTVRVVGAMLEREPGEYLITQRQKTASLPLLWEFPGGRAHEGEDDAKALVRELKERLGIDVVVTEAASTMRHEYADYDVDFRVFHCHLKDPAQPIDHSKVNDHRWATLDEMSIYEFPAADQRTLAKLLELED